MGRFPVFLNPTGETVLVIGGGKVAARKAKTLVNAGYSLHIVAPEMEKELLSLADSTLDRVKLSHKAFSGEIEGAPALVIAATDDKALNARICALAKKKHILVNCATSEEESTFTFPAVVNRGDVTVAVGTAGKSPALSAEIRKRVEEILPESLGEALPVLEEMRENLIAADCDREEMKRILHEWAVRVLEIK